MAFTELFCHTTGSNLNGGGLASGADPSDSAAYTGVGDSNGTNVFTPSDGSTPSGSVAVGDWASIFVTAGAVTTGFVGRVTAVAAGVNGAITVSTTAASGTFPANSAGAHTISCKVGGAWKGPNAAVGFPFNFIAAAQTNAAGDTPRVNLKGGTNYAITAAMTHALAGPVRFQGYTTTAGDGGRATIDGGVAGASYVLFTPSGTQNDFADLIFQNNGATGSASGVVANSTGASWRRCVFSSFRGIGVLAQNSQAFVECEFYGCNQSNTASLAAVSLGSNGILLHRCYVHDNAGSNGNGVKANGVNVISDSVIESNGRAGVFCLGGNQVGMFLVGCDFYANGTDGIQPGISTNTVDLYAENCNFANNGGYGIGAVAGVVLSGHVVNCAFGSGTAANTSGQTNNMAACQVIGSITLPANQTPWNAPSTGDFRVTLSQCKGAGRGAFTQTGSSKTGTVAFPDVGAAQHKDAGGGQGIIGG